MLFRSLLNPSTSTNTASEQLHAMYDGQLQRLVAMGVDAYNIIQVLPLLYHSPDEYFEGVSGLLTMTDKQRVSRQMDWAKFIRGIPRKVTERYNIEPVEKTITN